MGTASVALDSPHSGSRWERLIEFLREELKPQPGRLRATFVRIAGVLLALWIGLALNLPEISAVLALAFFAAASDREESKKVALAVPPAVLVIFVLLNVLLAIFGATPLVRVLAWIVIVFSSLFFVQAARMGAAFLLTGIFGKLFLGLWDSGYPTVLIEELQGWILADLVLAGLCAFAVSIVFGTPPKDPVVEFRKQLALRFELLARVLSSPATVREDAEAKTRDEAIRGSEQLLASLENAAKKSEAVKGHRRSLVDVIRLNALLLHQAVILQTYSRADRRELQESFEWTAERCAAIAEAVRFGGHEAPMQQVPEGVREPLAVQMAATVRLAEKVLAGKMSLPDGPGREPPKGFLKPDAFTNPAYFNKAFRAFLAAFACYCLIAATNYSGIGTAVTTCLITALTSVQAARQKQSLRIGGAILGAILGFFAIVVVLPQGGLVGLSVVTASVTFLGGWIYAGSPRVSYAGVQLALCYYLGVFGENQTPTSLTSIRDRVIGILIGNVAMWLFYDRIQPAWTADAARGPIAEELRATGRLATARAIEGNDSDVGRSLECERKKFSDACGELQALRDRSGFDFGRGRAVRTEISGQLHSAEIRSRQLFSFEFAAAEAGLLGLPQIAQPSERTDISKALFGLAAEVTGEAPPAQRGKYSTYPQKVPEAAMFGQIESELRILFP